MMAGVLVTALMHVFILDAHIYSSQSLSVMRTCTVLLCLVVCLTFLASFFLPSSSLINIIYVHIVGEEK